MKKRILFSFMALMVLTVTACEKRKTPDAKEPQKEVVNSLSQETADSDNQTEDSEVEEKKEAVSFASFVLDTLIPQHGLITEHTFERGYTVANAEDYSLVVEADYTAQQGILMTKELDLDADDESELLIVYRECTNAPAYSFQASAPQWTHRFEIYEADDLSQPAGQGIWDTGDMDAQPWSDDTYYCAFLKESNGEPLLCYTGHMGYTVWSDGEGYLLRGFRYGDKEVTLVAEAFYEGSAMDDGVPEDFLNAADKLNLQKSAERWKTDYEDNWYAKLIIEEDTEDIQPLFLVRTTSNIDDNFWSITDIYSGKSIDEEALKQYRIRGEILIPME